MHENCIGRTEMASSEDALREAWRCLRLSVRCPSRIPTWDAVVVTAASPQQAELYNLQLRRAKDRGKISQHCVAVAVPDPGGRRIGSGGATLAAIRTLAEHFMTDKEALAGKRVLLVHAGGDSRRVPWANAIGKAFIPLPFLAEDHPDEPAPLLFDHILAISARMAPQFPKEGGIFIMTGDVLPCFDPSKASLPQDGAVVVTTPASLEVASNHGVIVSQTGDGVAIVDELLQKPNVEEMQKRGAIRAGLTALLDTGIFSVTGEAWRNLVHLACLETNPVNMLLENGQEMSLYEEVAGAWVPARHGWLQTRPLGLMLIQHLRGQRLYHYCANDMQFLHFGTSGEILQHLNSSTGLSSLSPGCHFSYVNTSSLRTSATVLSSRLDSGAIVGDGSLVFNCALGDSVKIGSNCVVLSIRQDESWVGELLLPDKHCLWEVPLKDGTRRVILCCSIEDNPKTPVKQGGIFCGRTWEQVLSTLRISKEDLWDDGKPNDLWTAKLFPIVSAAWPGIQFAGWLMGDTYDEGMLKDWRSRDRLSFAVLQEHVDFGKMFSEMSNHQARLAAHLARASLHDCSLRRNLSTLTREILYGDEVGVDACKELLALFPSTNISMPASRIDQARVDVTRACGDDASASVYEECAFKAVASETAASVAGAQTGSTLLRLHPSRSSTVRLPVRVDFVGGWSDTPPWSVERKGCVLNMAVLLNGAAPVGAEVLLKKTVGFLLLDDAGNRCAIDDPTRIVPPFDESDPFRLVKAALMVTGFTEASSGKFPWGLEVRTWSDVPRGSGLGTSSILAAAVVRALLEVIDGNTCDENVASLVLVVEQVMGTGGGWQDQVGAIYPGLKCTTSIPSRPLKFTVETLSLSPALKNELEQRLLLVFTGQVRLAHMVLQKVVTRYLQRDSLLISSIQRLACLARLGQQAFANCDLNLIGKVMLEAWHIHQELDPFCSNSLVDSIFKAVDHLTCGYKLVGAGGGGFAILMSKDRDSASVIKELLTTSFQDSISIYNWSLAE